MPRVSEILDAFPEAELVAWKLRMGRAKAEEISLEALAIGTFVDDAVQRNLRGELFTPTDLMSHAAVVSCLTGWNQFLAEHPWFAPSVIQMQPELTYQDLVGHPDFELMRAGAAGIVDLKCASAIRPSYWTQVAAYGWLRQQSDGIPISFLGILRLDKQTPGKFEYLELRDPQEIDYEVSIWLAYRQLYGHRQRVAERTRLALEAEQLGGI